MLSDNFLEGPISLVHTESHHALWHTSTYISLISKPMIEDVFHILACKLATRVNTYRYIPILPIHVVKEQMFVSSFPLP